MSGLIGSWCELEKYLDIYKNIALENRKIVLFGAGMQGSFALEYLQAQCANIYFCDNNESIWDTEIEGYRVIPPKKIAELNNPLVVITTLSEYCPEIKRQIEKYGIECVSYFEYIFIQNHSSFKSVFEECLTDLDSKKIFINLIKAKLSNDMELFSLLQSDKQYFALPSFCKSSKNTVMVDCGAFVGDSIESFITLHQGNLKRIYGFEPAKRQFDAMKARKDRLIKEWALEDSQITLELCAVGEANSENLFVESSAVPSVSSVSRVSKGNEGKECISVISLDEYFGDRDEKISFIKADIEGSELSMLKGAKNILIKDKPLIAICVYHRATDLFELTQYLKKIVPEYNMSLRHHSYDEVESVLYCYI